MPVVLSLPFTIAVKFPGDKVATMADSESFPGASPAISNRLLL